MKKWIARLVVVIVGIGIAGILIHELYIYPIQKVESVDTPMEYVGVILLITALHAMVLFLAYWLIKGIQWAVDNAD